MRKKTEENLIDTEKLSVGTILKEARLKKSKELDKVADDLKIRRVYLEAIEKSDYKNVPEYPYGVGFVNSYACYLGFDGVEFAEKFKKELNPTESRNKESLVKENLSETPVPSKKNLYLSVGALVMVIASWSFFFSNGDQSKSYEQETTLQEEVVAQTIDEPTTSLTAIESATTEQTTQQITETKNSTTQESAVEVAPTPEVVTAQQDTIADKRPIVKIFDETWIEVKTEDTLYLSKVLQAGDEYVLPNADGLIFSVGKINGAALFVDGKKLDIIKPSKKTNISLDEYLNKSEEVNDESF